MFLERAVREQRRPQKTAVFQGSQAGDSASQGAEERSWAWCGLTALPHVDGMVETQNCRLHTHSYVHHGPTTGHGYCAAWVAEDPEHPKVQPKPVVWK